MRTQRLRHLLIVLAGVLAVLSARMVQLQVIEHETWAERARRSRLEKRTIPAQRGRILDRDGRVLAEDRRSFDLMFEYRSFRRGQAVGQLFELCQLVNLPVDGLDGCLADRDALVEQVLALPPERVAALGSRRQGDALYYLRRLAGFGRERAEELELWTQGPPLPFGEAFPEARASVPAAVDACVLRLAELEFELGDRLGEPLWDSLEFRRLDLEERIRRHALREAAAAALQRDPWEVHSLLARSARPSTAAPETGARPDELLPAIAWDVARHFALTELAARWQWPGALDALAAHLVGEGDAAPGLDELGALLGHIERHRPEDVQGLRRELVASVHRDRVTRLVRGVDFATVDRIGQDREAFAGLQIHIASDRMYPEELAPQLVGTVRIANDRDLEAYLDKRDRLRALARKLVRTPAEEEVYRALRDELLRHTVRPGQMRGLDGVEAAFEDVLRGQRGFLRELAGGDEEGRPRELEFVPPVKGRDVRLSLSVPLMRAAHEAIDAAFAIARDHKLAIGDTSGLHHLEPPRAGFALIDLRDGTLPVLASSPQYVRAQVRDGEIRPSDYDGVGGSPFRHRALGGMPNGRETPYPGSTFKPLVAAAALQRDPAAWNRGIYCDRGWLPPGMTPTEKRPRLSCPNHPPATLDMHDALKKSCNTYFYTLAHEMGWGAVWSQAHALGFGAPTGIELVEVDRIRVPEELREAPGDDGARVVLREGVPNRALERGANYLGSRHREHYGLTNAHFGIGQVAVQASPLQMARFYGWLATGRLMTPRLVLSSGGGAPAVPAAPEVPLDPGVRARIHEALCAVTADPGGTAWDARYRLDVFRVAGKTGTAETGGNGPTHAWFAGYFPWDEPRWAFAILCENTDLHGGDIADVVLHQFLSSPEARAFFSSAEN